MSNILRKILDERYVAEDKNTVFIRLDESLLLTLWRNGLG